MREVLLDRLKQDLIGPHEVDEILNSRPSDVYLTGILWPQESLMGAEEDERFGLSGGDTSETDGGGEEEEISLVGLKRPSSAGVSFAARSVNRVAEVEVSVQFAMYEPVSSDEQPSDSEMENGISSEKGRNRNSIKWQRKAYKIQLDSFFLENGQPFTDLEPLGGPPGVRLHLRSRNWSGGSLSTITLLNQARPNEDEGREGVERLTLFQVRVEISPRLDTVLVARPSRRTILDNDDRSTALLFRNAHEFANGHTCSAEWKASSDPTTASMIATSWIPTSTVPATSTAGHKIFDSLRVDSKHSPLSARWLAKAEPSELAEALLKLPAAYKKWIDARVDQATTLPKEFEAQAQENIEVCCGIHARMVAGAERIACEPDMSHAFRLANLAMDVQYGWDSEKSRGGFLEWRPFQLGFMLLAAASVVDRQHPDRQYMDLLWFPTGGGKTEAYLALVAFLAFYRRLSADPPDSGRGVAAIMRYTLRLLTTQQFVRASAVLLACEAIRRGRVKGTPSLCRQLGSTPFSIGLWVGGDAVPNKVKIAAEALADAPDQPTPKQLVRCPACRERLSWKHDFRASAIHVRCENEHCLLFDSDAPLPVWTVDEDVYRKRPTLLIGTIDKYAQIVRQKNVSNLFGLNDGHPPDLILQDELHLISGPLGTVAGLYEAAVDQMFSSGGARPKIIGSTATIRRASEQVESLFDRKTAQFPPPCISADDSAFAVVDRRAPGRKYAAVTTAGRSAKFALQAVAASLLQSSSGGSTEDRDPYWTLVSYFNSLRELGGALVLMQDDVNASIDLIAKRRNETERHPDSVEELTSRLTQAEVRTMLDRLGKPSDDDAALDVILATNMLSVGVDIPRLGLMLVNGQPKGISEYIQATSRVGRGNVPGLVVSVLNNAKARDRSHFESFPAWHETLYRDVEPTSVTPFASRARDLALRAVLVALVRHLVPGMLDRPELTSDSIDFSKELIRQITKRASVIDPDETEVQSELDRYLGEWEFRAPKSYWLSRNIRNSLLQDAERAATLRAMGRLPGDAWPTLNNMRSVEPSTRFRLAERLRKRELGEKVDGK